MLESIMGFVLMLIAVIAIVGIITGFVFLVADIVYFGRPLWRTYYPPEQQGNIDFAGGYSRRSSYWVARDYAKIFNGEVVKHRDVSGRPVDPSWLPRLEGEH